MEYVYTDDTECCGWLTRLGSIMRYRGQEFHVFPEQQLISISGNVVMFAASSRQMTIPSN